MGEILTFEPTEAQFGVFWKYLKLPYVTDVDFNGKELWITDLKQGRYCAKDIVTDEFIQAFTHNISNCVNKQFNNANKILEADTRELRISIIHNSVTASGISICIRKSPCIVRNTIERMITDAYLPEEMLHLLINCVQIGMNFVFGGEPGAGKTECAKFFMQFIPKEERVITIEDSYEIHYGEVNAGADTVELRVGSGFSYTDAIKASLRQNPKWLMLSEARSIEVSSLLEQWSTGVHGFTTIHLDDVRKLPDRIQNMMSDVRDMERMENIIYRYVDIGILIRCHKNSDGSVHRYVEQMCFFSREGKENCIYMLMEEGEIVSKELPPAVQKRFIRGGIENPFVCKNWGIYKSEGK